MSPNRLEYHQGAIADAKSAVAWYKKHSLKAASDFIEELRQAAETILAMPDSLATRQEQHQTLSAMEDYAHNNAGIIEGQLSIHEYPDDQWDRIIANNLTSVFLCMKHEIPVMLGQGGGAIVNVASETAYKGNAGDAAYTASKHGVWGLTTVAALRYVKRNIRVNAIAPGNVRTGITERAQAVTPPEIWSQIERANPIGRLIEPSEIAELVVWLCSDQAALVNGTLVAADTGWHVA